MDKYKILLILASVLAVIATLLAFLTIFNLCEGDMCGSMVYPKKNLNGEKNGLELRVLCAVHCLALIFGTSTIILSAIPLCTKMGENMLGSFLLTLPICSQ